MHKLLIDKMKVKYNDPVDYYIQLDDRELYVNDLIGKKFQLYGLNDCLLFMRKKKKKFYRQKFLL